MFRMMLSLILYFLIVAHKASCHSLSNLLKIYEDMVHVLLMLQVLLTEDPLIEYLLCGAPSRCLHGPIL